MRVRRSYEQHTGLAIRGRGQRFDHRDRNTLKKIAEPIPNPLARRHGVPSP